MRDPRAAHWIEIVYDFFDSIFFFGGSIKSKYGKPRQGLAVFLTAAQKMFAVLPFAKIFCCRSYPTWFFPLTNRGSRKGGDIGTTDLGTFLRFFYRKNLAEGSFRSLKLCTIMPWSLLQHDFCSRFSVWVGDYCWSVLNLSRVKHKLIWLVQLAPSFSSFIWAIFVLKTEI